MEKESYDYIIVGSGNVGAVIANRLSENGKFTVCVLEAGRDEARLSQLLPKKSNESNVPQPGNFNWGQYSRSSLGAVQCPSSDRGFTYWRFLMNKNENSNRIFDYSRCSQWGGCTSGNSTIYGPRNHPSSWDSWAKMGLDEWSFDNIKDFYKKVENRSMHNSENKPYYSENIKHSNLGSFSSEYYGYNGNIPLLWFDLMTDHPWTNAVLYIVNI